MPPTDVPDGHPSFPSSAQHAWLVRHRIALTMSWASVPLMVIAFLLPSHSPAQIVCFALSTGVGYAGWIWAQKLTGQDSRGAGFLFSRNAGYICGGISLVFGLAALVGAPTS